MTDIQQLAEGITTAINKASEQVPMDYRLWTVDQIAVYMRRSKRVVQERTITLPGFPQPIRLPTQSGTKGNPLWKAREVVEWVESHQEKRCA